MDTFQRATYKIRRATTSGGHEVSIPPAWLKYRQCLGYGEGELIEMLYGPTILVIVPAGVGVNEKKLAAAAKRIK